MITRNFYFYQNKNSWIVGMNNIKESIAKILRANSPTIAIDDLHGITIDDRRGSIESRPYQ